MKRAIIYSFIVFLFSSYLVAQQKPILLNGSLLNAETLEPITTENYLNFAFLQNKLIAVQQGPSMFWGAIDWEGNIVVVPKYSRQLYFNEGIAIGQLKGLSLTYEVIDETGKVLYNHNFKNIWHYKNGLAVFLNQEGNNGMVDVKGNIILKPKYSIIGDNIIVGKNRLIAVEKDDAWGIVNQKGKTILPFKYDDITWLKDDVFLLSVVDKENSSFTGTFGTTITNFDFGLWSSSKGMISETMIDHIKTDEEFLKNDLVLFRPRSEDAKWGLMDLAGKEVLNPQYDEISYISDNRIALGKATPETGGSVYAMSDLQGYIKIDYLLKSIGKMSNGLISVCMTQNNQYGCGYVDADGLLKIQMNYTGAKAFNDDNNAQVGYGQNTSTSWGLIDKENQILIPMVFDNIEKVSTNFYKVGFKNNAYEYLIDANTMQPVGQEANYVKKYFAAFYYSINDYPNAIKYFQSLYDAGKANNSEITNLSKSYSRSGQYDKALKYINVLLLTPANEMSDRLKVIKGDKAYVLWKQGKTQEAKTLYEETFEGATQNMIQKYSEMRMEFAEMLTEMNLGHDAIEQYQIILKTFDTSWSVYDKMGVLQLTIDLKDDSIESFNQSLQINPSGKDAYFYRGQAYSLKKEYATAINDFKKAIELEGTGDLTSIHAYLADAFFASGQKDKACDLWKQLSSYIESDKAKAAENCNN